MKRFKKKIEIATIKKITNGTFIPRDKNEIYSNVAELHEADVSSICFFQNHKYMVDLSKTKAGLIFVHKNFDQTLNTHSNLVLVDNPYLSFMITVKHWLDFSEKMAATIHESSAIISKSAIIEEGVGLKHNVVIGDNVSISSGTIIESNTVVMENCIIGKNTLIYPNTTLYPETVVGNNVIIHSGCTIGADGFGYLYFNGQHHKVPQIGNVVIEDDVEIGANSTIDRATIGTTLIEKGSKIDNLVQVAHNCKIGKNNIICAQTGLAGNTNIGNNNFIAGQVGVAGHLTIGDNVKIGAQSGIAKDVPSDSTMFGTPAIDASLQKRIIVSLKKLPEIVSFFNKFIKKNSK